MVSPLNIIVVDDHLLAREEIEILLARQGWRVRGADTAEDMDEQIREEIPQVVLLDVNLPHEDGYRIAARLRQSHPSVGIIMLTGRTRPADKADGYQAGADVYLTKPVNPDEVIAAIRNLSLRLAPKPVVPRLLLHRATQVLSVDGSPGCRLTTQELRFLELLSQQHDQEASADLLCQGIRVSEADPLSRENLTVLVSRLRTKTDECPGLENLISAIRGYGYRLNQRFTLI